MTDPERRRKLREWCVWCSKPIDDVPEAKGLKYCSYACQAFHEAWLAASDKWRAENPEEARLLRGAMGERE